MSAANPISISIADGSAIFRLGLQVVLEPQPDILLKLDVSNRIESVVTDVKRGLVQIS